MSNERKLVIEQLRTYKNYFELLGYYVMEMSPRYTLTVLDGVIVTFANRLPETIRIHAPVYKKDWDYIRAGIFSEPKKLTARLSKVFNNVKGTK